MSGLGGNLNYKTRPLLITNLAVTDFGTYTETDPDSGATVEHLVSKKQGLDMAYDATCKLTKSCTQSGKLKSVLLALTCPAPASLTNYSYGIDILKKVKDPGVLNDDWIKKTRHYGGEIASLQTPSGGLIADVDLKTMEDAIITQILADRGFGSREEAIVDAKRIYLVTRSGAVNTDALLITQADGTEITVLLDGGTTVQTAIDDVNAVSATTGVMAFAKSATEMYITSVDNGVLFTVADGLGASIVAINQRYIWLVSRDADNQFEVQFPSGWLTLQRFNVLILANAWVTGITNLFSIDGTNSGAINGAAISNTFVTNINSDGVLAIYASSTRKIGGVPIYIWSGIYELKVVRLSSGVTVTTAYSGGGVYPSLTWKDVFREFSQVPAHLDGLSHLVPLTQPATGEVYCKIRIEKTNTIANMHGANHGDSYLQVFEFYLKQGSGATHLWDASNYMWESTADNAAFSADSDINDMISQWSGAVITPAIP